MGFEATSLRWSHFPCFFITFFYGLKLLHLVSPKTDDNGNMTADTLTSPSLSMLEVCHALKE